jgi:hypothetical protein
MKKNILLPTLLSLAVVLLSACSNDEVFPTELAGKWQLLYKEYPDGTIDTDGSGDIVNFVTEKKYSFSNGYLKVDIPDGYLMYNYIIMDNGQKIKLDFVSSEGIVFAIKPPTEVYQKIK